MKRLLLVSLLSTGLFQGCHIDVGSVQSNNPKVKKLGGGKSELSESDVIGINRAEKITEADIKQAFQETRVVKLAPKSRVLLIEAGASAPDQQMVKEASAHFSVVPHSGLPLGSELGTNPAPNAEQASRALRFEAAKAGADSIIAYWSTLEIAKQDLPTQTVSWIPVLDLIIPDQAQHVRARTKFAIVDARTGAWTVFNAQPYEADTAATAYSRAHSDDSQIKAVKRKAFHEALAEIIKAYPE